MRSEQRPLARRYWAALIFLMVGTLAGVWHNRTTSQGHSDIVVSTVRGAVAPPASLLARVSRWFSVQTGWIFHGHTVAMENQELRKRVAQLEGENTSLREASIKYDQLREDLGFVRNAKQPPLAADVLFRRPDPKFDTLVISRGGSQGVHPHSVVVTRNGLVGQVSEVTPGTATVVMLTNESPGASGRVQRPDSRTIGICKGDFSPLLWMTNMPFDANIKPGDAVVTSGLGGIYPPGILIGTVTEAKIEVGNTTKSAHIRPAVDFDKLEEVYILP